MRTCGERLLVRKMALSMKGSREIRFSGDCNLNLNPWSSEQAKKTLRVLMAVLRGVFVLLLAPELSLICGHGYLVPELDSAALANSGHIDTARGVSMKIRRAQYSQPTLSLYQ